jgi:EEF1A lysine methyltransferase 4
MHTDEQERKEHGRDAHYDWYFPFEKIRPILETYFGEPQGQRVLVVGCGNSTLSADLFNYGFTGITSIDLSARVITQLQERYRGLEGLEFSVADARSLDAYPDEHFDCVLDKGLMDSLFCSFRPEDDVLEMHTEVSTTVLVQILYNAIDSIA